MGRMPDKPPVTTELIWSKDLEFGATSGTHALAVDGDSATGPSPVQLLAVALASKPEALVLDDPTLGLDTIARRELLAELVRDLADHGTTTLISTHDFAAVEGLATHIGIMKAGRLVLAGELEKIKASYGQVDADPMRTSGDAAASLEEVFTDLVERKREEAA